uniref:SFRICE_013214 n=1 Tax=Spodoptera frugiperda TaxID=7108 RepID=A0A2H1V864_SPOFR
MHRRQEMEARTQIFHEKCDRAVEDIKRLKMKTEGFAQQLNCDPNELKERFLNCMKQLDEYMYLITDFNIAISKLEEASAPDNTPVHDTTAKPLTPTPMAPYNLIDALSEPAPSTSTSCPNNCPPEKPKRVKIPKENQSLIVFSSTSTSEESVRQVKNDVAAKEVQCELDAELRNVKIEGSYTFDSLLQHYQLVQYNA